MKKSSSFIASLLLLIGVFFWGCTFVIVKEAVTIVDPFSFVGIRFAIASIIIGLFFTKNFKKINKKTIVFSIISGIILAVSFLLQTFSLKYTSASNSAFITGLCVVLVPVYVTIIDRKLPTVIQLISVFAALAGLVLMTLNFPIRLNFGDLLAFLCAIGFGLQIVLVGRLPDDVDASLFTIIQLFIVSVFSLLSGFIINGGLTISLDWVVVRAILFCAIFATAYIYIVQSHLQRNVSEIKAVIIYSFEPVFAAVVAYLYLGESLSGKAVSGAFLIFAAMIMSEIKLSNIKTIGK